MLQGALCFVNPKLLLSANQNHGGYMLFALRNYGNTCFVWSNVSAIVGLEKGRLLTSLGISWMIGAVALVLELVLTKDAAKWAPDINTAILVASLLLLGVGAASVL